jgi:hypothetical protein
MLLLEEKVRMSDAYILECTLVKDEVNGWLRVSEYVQQEIAKRFGYTTRAQNIIAVNLMRIAHTKYKNDPKFRDVSVYVRNNIANIGTLKVNDPFIDVNIISTQKDTIKLSNILDKNKPNIIISSSET